MTKIAVADDSEVIRNLIEEIVRYEPDLDLVGSFETGPEIVAWTREGGRADIYLIDMRLPGLSGTATIRALRRFLTDERIIAFSASAQESSVDSALAAGANRYVVKDSSLSDLLAALRSPDGDPSASANRAMAGWPEPDDRPDGKHESTVVPPPTAPAVEHRFTVMIVDDHEIVRDTTAALLESRGIHTARFATGDAALEWVAGGGNPAAALIDLRMDGENGLRLMRNMREALPNAAIFVHSGVSNVEGEQAAKAAGLDGFIAKGELSASSLEATLARLVAKRRHDA